MDSEASGSRIPEIDVQPDEIPELNKSISTFDRSHKTLLEACQEHASSPCQETNDTIASNGNVVIQDFKNTLATLCQEIEPAEIMQAITTLIISNQLERVTVLSQLTPSKKFLLLDSQYISQSIGDHFLRKDTQQFIDKVAEIFDYYMCHEVNLFTKKVYKRYLIQQAITTTITVAKDPQETGPGSPEEADNGDLFAFSIQPPIDVLSPDFIDNVVFTHVDQTATYGSLWVSNDLCPQDTSLEDMENTKHEYMFETFNKALNPLGNLALEVKWPRDPLPEFPEDEG